MIEDTEQKLIKYGFTSKEIASIKFWSERDGASCGEIIKRIKRVFLAAMFLLFMFLALVLKEFIRLGDDAQSYLMLASCVFGVMVIFIMAPMKIGAKICLKYRG